MLNVAIIIGSTRPGRVGESVAKWVYDLAHARGGANFELIDLLKINLPLLDESTPPSMGQYQHEHTKKWAQLISKFDAFIFVTPEYNHAPPASLKNALDFIYGEWNNKVAGFVGYGSAGGTRSVEQLRLMCAELQMATVRSQVALSLMTDFENFKKFKPQSFHEVKVNELIDQLIMWGTAFQELRGTTEETLAEEGISSQESSVQ